METIPLFDRFSLRALRPDDARAIFASIDTQREYLGRWLPFVASTRRIEQTRDVVRDMLADPTNPVFTLRDGDVFAGLIGFKGADRPSGTIEIGYWLREEFQGRGIVTTAVRALCELAFSELGIRTVVIRCGTENSRSNRIPQRLGFRMVRTEEHAERMSDGTWIDLHVYQLEK